MLVTLRCERVNEGSSSSQLLKHFLLFPPPPLVSVHNGNIGQLENNIIEKGRGEGGGGCFEKNVMGAVGGGVV